MKTFVDVQRAFIQCITDYLNGGESEDVVYVSAKDTSDEDFNTTILCPSDLCPSEGLLRQPETARDQALSQLIESAPVCDKPMLYYLSGTGLKLVDMLKSLKAGQEQQLGAYHCEMCDFFRALVKLVSGEEAEAKFLSEEDPILLAPLRADSYEHQVITKLLDECGMGSDRSDRQVSDMIELWMKRDMVTELQSTVAALKATATMAPRINTKTRQLLSWLQSKDHESGVVTNQAQGDKCPDVKVSDFSL